MPIHTALIRLLVAAVLGGLVGYERETIRKPAGLRTMMLVGLGSCLFTLASSQMAAGVPNADPARIAAQVVSGIGFLGAGSIIRAGTSVVGVTTAASIWLVAAVGLATGAGLYIHAVFATILAYAILRIVERFLEVKKYEQEVEGARPDD